MANFQRAYGGPAIPTTWDPSWNSFTNLTPAQIAAFQAFPQDLTLYTSSQRWQFENRMFAANRVPLPNNYVTIGGVPVYPSADNIGKITAMALDAQMNAADSYTFTVSAPPPTVGLATVYTLTAAQAIALFSGVRAYVQQCRDIEGQLVNGINGGTITSRAQIDAAFAGLV